MHQVDRDCTTHYIRDCLQSRLDVLEAENTELRAALRLACETEAKVASGIPLKFGAWTPGDYINKVREDKEES